MVSMRINVLRELLRCVNNVIKSVAVEIIFSAVYRRYCFRWFARKRHPYGDSDIDIR